MIDFNIMEDKKTFLFISAHPDDDVLVGGTILKLKKAGWKTVEIVCTKGEGEQKDSDSKKIATERVKEIKSYQKNIGLDEVFFLNGKDGFLSADEKFTTEMVKLIRKISPSVIIVLNDEDYHHDHRISHKIALHAIELATRKAYLHLGKPLTDIIILQTDGLNVLPNPLITFNTTNSHQEKVSSIRQAYKKRIDENLMTFLDGLAMLRGGRIGCQYAEAYNLINPQWYKFTEKSSKVLFNFVKIGS